MLLEDLLFLDTSNLFFVINLLKCKSTVRTVLLLWDIRAQLNLRTSQLVDDFNLVCYEASHLV